MTVTTVLVQLGKGRSKQFEIGIDSPKENVVIMEGLKESVVIYFVQTLFHQEVEYTIPREEFIEFSKYLCCTSSPELMGQHWLQPIASLLGSCPLPFDLPQK